MTYHPLPPSTDEIEKLKGKLKKFKSIIKISDGSFITHTVDKPYPVIYTSKGSMELEDDNSNLLLLKKKLALDKLTCYLTRNNAEEGDSLLGYPMKIKRDKFKRIYIVPVFEILSYEGYMLQIMNDPEKVYNPEDFDTISLKTALGHEYNYWFPLYTNEGLYNKYKQHIFNAFSILKFGVEGKKD